MREYCFICDSCNEEFSIFAEMQDIPGYIPPCPTCKKITNIYRNFGNENVGFKNAIPKTIGALADKRSEERLKKGLSLTPERTKKNVKKK